MDFWIKPCVINVVEMVTKNVVANLTKGEKIYGTKYDMWHRNIQYLLNQHEVLETKTNGMTQLEQGNTIQHHRDILG